MRSASSRSGASVLAPVSSSPPAAGCPVCWRRCPDGRANAAARAVVSRPEVPERRDGIDVWTSAAPERVLPSVHDAFRPDVVVVNSVHRKAWTSLRSWLRNAGTPVVLYVREAATLEHIPVAMLAPDLLLTNSEALQQRVAKQGASSACVPSVIDFSRCEVATSADVVLFVNPIPSRGLSVAVGLASDNPDVPFAFQVSWPLDRRDERALHREVDRHQNVELRQHEANPARVYRDARVLLLPYLVDQRPRVVAEAQYNGVPVLASDLPGHREAVGQGGLFVPVDGSRDAWNAAFRALLDDATRAATRGGSPSARTPW